MNTLDYIVDKFKLDLKQRSPIDILDLGREDLAFLFCELGFTKGAEIGVLVGKYSRKLKQANPGLELYGIDPWLSYPEYPLGGPQSGFDSLYESAKQNVLPGTKLIRKKSMDAVHDFPDNSLDFVYIDGNHDFTSEANDIHEWSKKVRPDGIISGHDYRPYRLSSLSHSYEVVNAYTGAYRINPWFVIGRNKNHVRSWFWIKK